MTAQTENDRLDNVASGDLIALTVRSAAGQPRQYKVVHTGSRADPTGPTMLVTVESDDGATCAVELPADTVVVRTLESKWESAQSPTPHDDGQVFG